MHVYILIVFMGYTIHHFVNMYMVSRFYAN